MKEQTSARRGVMRSAMFCCAQWAPVVPAQGAAMQAASAGVVSAGSPAADADSGVSAKIRKAPLAS